MSFNKNNANIINKLNSGNIIRLVPIFIITIIATYIVYLLSMFISILEFSPFVEILLFVLLYCVLFSLCINLIIYLCVLSYTTTAAYISSASYSKKEYNFNTISNNCSKINNKAKTLSVIISTISIVLLIYLISVSRPISSESAIILIFTVILLTFVLAGAITAPFHRFHIYIYNRWDNSSKDSIFIFCRSYLDDFFKNKHSNVEDNVCFLICNYLNNIHMPVIKGTDNIRKHGYETLIYILDNSIYEDCMYNGKITPVGQVFVSLIADILKQQLLEDYISPEKYSVEISSLQEYFEA